MARPLVGDRVKETTQTSGTGTLSLAGAASGFRSFAQEFASGGKCYYLIVDDPTNTTQYEVGIGTFTAGTPNTLSRDVILESTNSNNAVSWDNTTKTVISTSNKLLLNSIADALDSDLVTAGTSTAFTLATYRPTAGLYEGRFVCAKTHTVNGANPALKVDGEASKPIVDINGNAPAAGAMPAAYYWWKYDATAGKWVIFSHFNSGFLKLGGTTSSFPALKQSGATIQARLADDSAYAQVIYKGTATNDSAAAGNVGEYVSGSTTGTSLTNNVGANIASISLTAGDWDVTGVAILNRASTTTSAATLLGISTTSATFGAAGTSITDLAAVPANALLVPIYSAPTVRISLASTTTVYLVISVNFSISTASADGYIRARRIR